MYNAVPDKGEVNTLPSLTRPNQAMTVLEILDRHNRGIPVNVSQGMPMYYGDQFEMPIWEKMDLQERLDYLAEWKSDIQEAKKRYSDQQTELRKKAKADQEAALRAQLAEIDKSKAAGATGSAGEGQ